MTTKNLNREVAAQMAPVPMLTSSYAYGPLPASGSMVTSPAVGQALCAWLDVAPA